MRCPFDSHPGKHLFRWKNSVNVFRFEPSFPNGVPQIRTRAPSGGKEAGGPHFHHHQRRGGAVKKKSGVRLTTRKKLGVKGMFLSLSAPKVCQKKHVKKFHSLGVTWHQGREICDTGDRSDP